MSASKLDEHDLGRHAEADRNATASKPRRHDEVTVFFDDVAANEAAPVPRRHNGREAGQRYLPSVRVSCNGQRDPFWDAWKNIRLMRHQQDRRIIADLGHCSRQIVHPDELRAAVRPVALTHTHGELVAKPGQPERVPILTEAPDVVLVDRNAGGFERTAGAYRPTSTHHRVRIIPPVVITKNCVHTKRRAETP